MNIMDGEPNSQSGWNTGAKGDIYGDDVVVQTDDVWWTLET